MVGTQRDRVYEGWRVVFAGFFCAMLCIGSTIYLFGQLVRPLTEELGLSRADANTGLIALLLGMAFWAPLIGRLVDSAPIRLIMPAGALLFAAGYMIIATSHSLVVMAAATFGPVSLGITAAGSLAAGAVTSRWFHRRRGRAMGIIAVATSTGGFLITPVATFLIQGYGWRTAMMVIGLGTAGIVTVLSLLFMRDRPTAAQLTDAGELTAGPGALERAQEPPWAMRRLLGDRNFWLIMLGSGFLLASDQVLIATKMPFYLDRGLSPASAALLISVTSASAMSGKLVIGFLAERFDVRGLFAGVALFHVVLLGLYIFWPGYWAMLVAVAVIGVAVGGVYPAMMTLIAMAFGPGSFGRAFGTMSLGFQPLAILSLRYAGEVFDRTGSYDTAFATFMGAALVSAVLIGLVRLPGTPARPAVPHGAPAAA